MKLAVSVSALALSLTVGACNKAPDAPPPPATPPAAPAAPADPHGAMGGAQAANPHAAADPHGAMGGGAMAGGAPAPSGDPFSGEVKLGDGVSADLIKPTDVIYLMARTCGADCSKPGMLVAVQRHDNVKLPMTFKLGPESVMMPGTPFVGPFLVQARVDRDGDAMTKDANDLYAEVTTGVKPGQSGVVLAVAPPAPGSIPAAAPAGGNPHGAPAGNPHGGAANPHGAAPAANPHGQVANPH